MARESVQPDPSAPDPSQWLREIAWFLSSSYVIGLIATTGWLAVLEWPVMAPASLFDVKVVLLGAVAQGIVLLAFSGPATLALKMPLTAERKVAGRMTEAGLTKTQRGVVHLLRGVLLWLPDLLLPLTLAVLLVLVATGGDEQATMAFVLFGMTPVTLFWAVVFTRQAEKGYQDSRSVDDEVLEGMLRISHASRSTFQWARWVGTLALPLAALGFPYVAQSMGGAKPLSVRVTRQALLQGSGAGPDTVATQFLRWQTETDFLLSQERGTSAPVVLVPRGAVVVSAGHTAVARP